MLWEFCSALLSVLLLETTSHSNPGPILPIPLHLNHSSSSELSLWGGGSESRMEIDLYTRVKVAIELYYKCVGTPPFLKKITPGLFALLVEVNFSFHFHSLTPVGIQSSSFICLLMLSSRISALFYLHIL